MKKKLFVVAIILLVSLLAFNIKIAKCASRPRVDWAILIAGTNAAINPFGQASGQTEEALHNCYYMFHVLKDHFGVPRNHILFLHIHPGSVKGFEVPYDDINGSCTSGDDVESAINWVKSQCSSSDNVLIFIASHGGGYWADEVVMTSGGREDCDGDEDGDGVDESIVFYDDIDNPGHFSETYYDDEFKQDLQGLDCNQLVVILESCFSGGFIDDLSASGRIIITASSETTVAQSDYSQSGTDHDGFSPFAEHFIDALHGWNTTWNTGVLNNLLIHENLITMPDYDDDGAVSWKEAYTYAKKHDPWDTPCFWSQPVCAMKTLTDGDFYVPTVATDLLKIEKLFDDLGIEGDQTGGSSPYETISRYPDGVVDGSDYQFVKSRIGQSEGSTNWDYMADVKPDGVIDGQDWQIVKNNVGHIGSYITDLSGVTVTFDTGEVLEPENGYVTIPSGAANFTVKQDSDPIGAMIIFW